MSTDEAPIVMPGSLNQVDILRLQIKEIQESCEHDYQFTKEPELKETLVNGVYVGHISGPIALEASIIQMALACIKCSKEWKTNIEQTCPRCLCKMNSGRCRGASSREEYFGKEYLYYSVKLSNCPKCYFTVASDEWDQ
jgi:hypothetical protein